MAHASPRQLLNTSWTLHRLSPLHHGKEFQSLLNNPIALKAYASRLRDQLTGDALAGLQAGLGATDEEASLSKTGALKECTWEMISAWSQLFSEQQERHRMVSRSSSGAALGILVVLEYENITYKAALLAKVDDADGGGGLGRNQRKVSTFLPLLLTRLPSALRQTFVSFLSTNFDTYCSLLRLPPSFMNAGMDVYLNRFMSTATQRIILEEVIKEMQLTLSFSPSIAPQLRSLNVNIPRASFMDFIQGGDSTEQPNRDASSPFLKGLSSYLEKHLAMKLDLGDSSSSSHLLAKQHVRLSKVACGGFVLGGEGRMKLVAPPGGSNGRTGDGSDDGDGSQSEKDKLMLQASEDLLRAVIQRAVIGESQAS